MALEDSDHGTRRWWHGAPRRADENGRAKGGTALRAVRIGTDGRDARSTSSMDGRDARPTIQLAYSVLFVELSQLGVSISTLTERLRVLMRPRMRTSSSRSRAMMPRSGASQ